MCWYGVVRSQLKNELAFSFSGSLVESNVCKACQAYLLVAQGYISIVPTQHCTCYLFYLFIWQSETLQYTSLKHFIRNFTCIKLLIEAINLKFCWHKTILSSKRINIVWLTDYDNKNQCNWLSYLQFDSSVTSCST